jgi:hypothetical protein
VELLTDALFGVLAVGKAYLDIAPVIGKVGKCISVNSRNNGRAIV